MLLKSDEARERLIVALDVPTRAEALGIVTQLDGLVSFYKVGYQLFIAEGMAFVKGTGINQPLGFLSSPNAVTLDGTRAMGTLQTIGTGVAGAFPATNPQDKLLDLVQSLRQPYR